MVKKDKSAALGRVSYTWKLRRPREAKKAVEKDVQGFDENKEVAKEGGRAAGKARTAYEDESGQKVVSPTNFKGQITEAKKNRKKIDKKSS